MPKPLNTSNNIKSVFIFICLLFSIEPVFSQHWFNKTFNIYDDSARQVQHIGTDFVKKPDGNVIVLSLSDNLHEYDTLNILKSYFDLSLFDKTGQKIDSSRYFFKGNFFSANAMLAYDSTSYFIGGNIINYYESFNKINGFDLMLIRINENLDTLWTKKYILGNDDEYINKLIKTPDGNVLLYGTKCNSINSKNHCEYYLLKVDTNGNEIYRKYYTSINSSRSRSGGIKYLNNRIITFGSSDSTNKIIKPYVFITDNNGNQLFSKRFDNIGLEDDYFFPSDLIVNQDGSMLLVGNILNGLEFVFRGYIIKLDSNLNVLWQRIIEGDENYFERAMKFNSKYMMVGYKKDERLNRYFAMVALYRENGNKVFERTYGIPNSNFTDGDMKSLNFVSDSAIWVIGEATIGKTPNNIQRTWIFTIDTFGCLSPGCAVLGVDDVPFTIEPLKVYPNPASDFVQLSHTEEIESYKIYDATARLITSGKYLNNIDVSNLANGLYYVHVMLKDHSQAIAKVVVSR